MQAELNRGLATPAGRLTVGAARVDDVTFALRAGLRDMARRPGLSLFFGLVYAVFGAVLVAGLLVFEKVWILIAVGVGFPLVAPFLAAGLYEMSRRLKSGEPFTATDIFLVIFRQRRREFGWMALVILFLFWMWAYQVRLWLAIFLQNHAHTMERLLNAIFTTADGAGFLIVGTIVGAVLATCLFTLTVISMPLLMDKDIDFITAMITSFKTVQASPAVMLGWGATVGALTLVAVAPAFLGVIVIFPLLGHASWHLYERLISET